MENKLTKVQKRDGTIVDFDQTRISDAIFKALTATNQGDGKRAKKLSDKVVQILNRRFKKEEIPHVEQIQDIVEEVLILEGLVETAKAYILYREQRRRIREAVAVVDESTEIVDRYLQELDWQVHENANMTYSLQGLNQYSISTIAKKYWLNKIYPKEIREAAANEDFHIHNLETLAPYCEGWDLYDLLLRGFGGVPSKIESRPAKHFRTALGQLVNFLFTLQGESAGANAVSNFDTLLAPFIRYDNLNYPQVKQAMQEFLYNCMVPTRVGFQSLAWDELVVIKDKNKIKFVEIGKLIDEEFEKNSHRILEEHPQSYAIQNYDDYYTLSFDSQGKAVWAKVKAFVRHKVPKNTQFLRIRTNRGEALVSPAHSLFAFEKFNGKFNPKPISASDVKIAFDYRQLNPKNHLLALSKVENEENKEEIDLVELIDEFPQLQRNVFVKINPTHTLSKIRENILNQYQAFHPFYIDFGIRDKGVWRDWLARKSIRYDIWRKFGEGLKDVQFRLKNSNIWCPRILKSEILENFVKLCAWYAGEGHKGLSTPIYISQSNLKNKKEIIDILKKLNSLGSVERGKGYSEKGNEVQPVYKIAGKGLLSEIIGLSSGTLSFNKIIPWYIFDLSKSLQKLFIESLLKGEATEYENHWDISTSSRKLSLSLSLLLAQNDIRFSVYTEKTSKKNKNWRDKLITRIFKEKSYYGKKQYKVGNFEARVCLGKEKVKYDKEYEYDISVDLSQENFTGGTGLLIFHNTPFLNVTIDIKPPEFLAKQPVIIGGKPQKETYGEFQEEMNIFNRTFYEGLMEGDAKGRPMTFPIPTVSITKDFEWDSPVLDPLWEATAKYGVNYFQNFVQSDMKPEDFRSMCLDGKEEILIRNSKQIKKASIQEIAESYKEGNFDKEGWADCQKEGNLEVLSLNPQNLKLEWSLVKRFFKIVDNQAVEIITEDGKKAVFSLKHPMAIYTPEGIKMKFAKDVKRGSYLLTLKKTSVEVLSKEYQKIEDLILDEDLAKILGYFVADGNYLFENRKGYTHFGQSRGLQFSFKTGDLKNLALIKSLVTKVFNLSTHEKQDPRYNTYYLYIYNTEIARKLYNAGFRKYGRLPQILFNSPKSVIKSFLEFHFKGDGYERRKEIHLNDLELSRDLVLLYSLIGQSVTYRLRKWSQVIYLQHSKSKLKKNNSWLNNPILAERVPAWIVDGKKIPGFSKSRMIGFDTIEKYKDQTVESLRIKNSDIYIARVKTVKKKTFKELKEFYDLELEKNHLFLHSLGQISFNCCRLRLSNKELYKRGGGLFGSAPLTGSTGVVTINMPRIGYLSKTKKDFFERLGHLMDLAKESLEIKRKALENFMEKGLYPYSKYYLASVKKLRDSYFGNHFSTIGLMGMNESLLNFIGDNIASKRGRRFAIEVLDFMRERLVKYQEETGNLYNLEATPGEGSLAPDEKVLVSQSDPKLTEIGSLVDKYMQNNNKKIEIIGNSEVLELPQGEMFTYGFSRNSLKIKKYPVTAVVRHKGRSMYEITTDSGRKVKVTGQHSVFTFSEDGLVEETLIRDLKKGTPIAVPKKIEMEKVHKEFNLIEIFKKTSIKNELYCIFPIEFIEKLINNPVVEKWSISNYQDEWKDTKYWWKKRGVVPLKLIYETGLKIDRRTLKSSKIFYRSTKNTKLINVLIPINTDLGFIIGSLLSEGWLSKRSEFTNTDNKFTKMFCSAVKRVFGEESVHLYSKTRLKEKRKTIYIATLSKIIGYFFKAVKIKGKSNEKKIPAFVFLSSSDCVAGLLRGFHLGDGTVYKNKEKSDLSASLSTNSKELLEGLNLCLLRFGILTKICLKKKSEYNSSWKNNYVLSITGADNLKKYFKLIFKKKIKINNLHSGREIISKAPALIKTIMQKHSIKPSDINIDKDSFNRNIRNNNISIEFLGRIVQKLSDLVEDEVIQRLKLLINSNLYWDKVKEIKRVATPKYVYDLEVEVENDLVNNFLGGEGLVCLHNTSYRQAKTDKEKYPEIITAGTKKVPYYTNSTMLPVNYTDDIFEALKLQDEIQCKYTGGVVMHLFLGERVSDPQMAKNLVKKVFENFHLPYLTLTPTFSICPSHGYLEGEHFFCPQCTIKQPCEVYSRVVGYLRPVGQYNLGKQQEFKERKTFKIKKMELAKT